MSRPLALVTGAPGWLGSRLVEALALGLPDSPELAPGGGTRRIRCLVLPGSDVSELRSKVPNLDLVEGDLRDDGAVARFVEGGAGATLFHAAGVIHPERGVREFYDVNVEGTRCVVDAANRVGVRRLVHVSSNSPFGFNPSLDGTFDEDAPYNPYMNYGRSKRQAEEIVREAGDAGRLETVVIRPPWFYGIGQPPRQSLFFTMIRTGKMPLLGGGENRRSMAYVDNICQGLLLCERVEGAAGRAYWIADRRPYSMNEIVDTVERLLRDEFGLSVSGKRFRLPAVVGEVARLIDGTVQGLGRYHQKFHVLSEMHRSIACSIERAERELGFDPKIDLEEGMRRSIRWVLDRGITI